MEKTTIFNCDSIGVSGTTPVHVKCLDDGSYEARMGIALFGGANMNEYGFKACDYDPFHEKFFDNYAGGIGASAEKAIADMKSEIKGIAESLWANCCITPR